MNISEEFRFNIASDEFFEYFFADLAFWLP